jgi:hypothetical protein
MVFVYHYYKTQEYNLRTFQRMDKKYQLVFKWYLIKFEIWILFHKSKMSKTRLNT